MQWVRLTLDRRGNRRLADSRAVARFRLARIAVDLHELRVVDVRAERILDRAGVDVQAVRGELHAAFEPVGQVMHQVIGRLAVTGADEPRDDELRVGINARPGPRIASIGRGALRLLDVRLFRVAERPDLIDLDALRPNAPDRFVVVGRAGLASVDEELGDRVDRCARDAANRSHRRALDEQVDDGGAPLDCTACLCSI